MAALIGLFHQNKGNAVENQHGGNHGAGVQVRVHPVVKQHAHQTGGDDGQDDLCPQGPGLLFFLPALSGGEGIQLVEVQYHHGQNGAQLNHHIKHTLEFRRYVQSNQLVQENQVARRADRQPFRHTLHNAEQHGLQ